MKKKLLSALICLCTLFMTACNSAGTISTYTIALESMPKNFDPQVASGANELLTLTNIYDGLFEYVNGEIVPNVCESYTVSADGLTYTFKLRSDSKFYLSKSEQIPVISADFAFALERVLDKRTHSPYYDDFKHIESITTPDDHTLSIRLSKADNEFISKLSMSAAYPCNKDFFEGTNGAYGLRVKDILSNGPFTINYLADDGSYATLVRVTEMEGGIDRIRVSLTDGQTSEADLYANDKISGFFAQNSQLSNVSGTVYSYENSLFNMVFNLEDEVLSNKNIRRAFSYYSYALTNSGANLNAVNQSFSIFTDAMTLGEHPVGQAVPTVTAKYMNNNAKEMLQNGLAELEKISIGNLSVLIPSDTPYSVIAENINQLWQKNLNAFLTVEFLPSAEIEKRIASGNYDIAFCTYIPSGNNLLEVIEPFAEYDSDIRHCVEKIKANTGSDHAVKYVSEAQSIILDNAYLVPMCATPTNYVHKSYFTGVDINPFGNIINLKYATVK